MAPLFGGRTFFMSGFFSRKTSFIAHNTVLNTGAIGQNPHFWWLLRAVLMRTPHAAHLKESRLKSGDSAFRQLFEQCSGGKAKYGNITDMDELLESLRSELHPGRYGKN